MAVVSEHDPYADVAQQEEDADLRRLASELEADADDKAFVWLMSGPRGRRFVYRLLSEAKVMQSSFNPNAMHMAKQEGRKEIGYWLLALTQRLCPAGYQTMMQENQNVRAAASDRSRSQN